MPADRNIDHYVRRSRRLSRQGPKSYDEDGFEHFDDADIFRLLSEPISADTSTSYFSPPPPPPPSRRRSEPYTTARPSHAKRKGDDHIPRPPNSFMVFRSDWWEKHKHLPAIERDHRQVSRIVAQQWKLLSEEERLPFRQEAEILKRQHALRYPGYKYAPGTHKSNKLRKRVSRDSRAEKAKCDKIVGDLFLQKRAPEAVEDVEVKVETPATPDFVPSSPPPASSTEACHAASLDNSERIYPSFPEGFVPIDDIPPLDLSSPDCKVEIKKEDSPFLISNEYAQQPLNFAYNTNSSSTFTDSPLGSPVPITPFPSETSFDDLCFGASEIDFLWNSTPPPSSSLFEPELLASNLSHSDYLLSCSNFFGSNPTTTSFDYDQYLNF